MIDNTMTPLCALNAPPIQSTLEVTGIGSDLFKLTWNKPLLAVCYETKIVSHPKAEWLNLLTELLGELAFSINY